MGARMIGRAGKRRGAKQGKEAGRPLDDFRDCDEGTHPAGPNPHWNESFYLNFFDPDSDWGVVSRVGFSPNRGFADGFVCIYFPDGATGFIRTWEPCPDHRGRASAGAIEHICVEPFRHWQIRYRGPIHYFEEPERMGDFAQTMLADLPRREIDLELAFRPIHPVFDFHRSMRREWISGGELLAKLRPGYFLQHLGPAIRKLALLRTMSGAQHYEHAGRIEGRICVDGESHAVAGYGQRDHSWGVRDMRVPASWRWFSGQLADEFCFNAIKVEVLGLRASGGYVHCGGETEALDAWSYRAEGGGPGRGPRRVWLDLVSRSGRRFEISGTTTANIPVLVNTEGTASVVNEARTRFVWGESAGFGVTEFMEQMGG